MEEGQELKVRTKIEVIIYEPINEIPETHTPQFNFSGQVISMKTLESISFNMRKALRKFKLDKARAIKEEVGEDGTE